MMICAVICLHVSLNTLTLVCNQHRFQIPNLIIKDDLRKQLHCVTTVRKWWRSNALMLSVHEQLMVSSQKFEKLWVLHIFLRYYKATCSSSLHCRFQRLNIISIDNDYQSLHQALFSEENIVSFVLELCETECKIKLFCIKKWWAEWSMRNHWNHSRDSTID